MTDTPALVAAEHPAKWSSGVLAAIAEVIHDEHERLGRPLVVLDPFAGVGRSRLVAALGSCATTVVGVELQPEWVADEATVPGDATDLPATWGGIYDAIVTSPCYGNRMADHHDAADDCKSCYGTGHAGPDDAANPCAFCKGSGKSWRNTYAHALRRQGGDLAAGSAAGMQWGMAYRDLHRDALMEMLRVTRPGGLLVVNMSNHLRGGEEMLVVEWWLNEMLHRGCSVVEVRRVATRRQRNGANGDARVDGEVVMVMRTPTEPRLL